MICNGSDSSGLYSPEAAWRCYNFDIGTEYDMPPDMYRQTLVTELNDGVMRVVHGPTSDNETELAIGAADPNTSYYANINLAVTNIANFFNIEDAALNAWEFNQITKPDAGGIGDSEYTNEAIEIRIEYDICVGVENSRTVPDYSRCEVLLSGTPINVHSQFIEDPLLGFDRELIWSQAVTEDSANILGSFIPGRTKPLGGTVMGTMSNVVLLDFTNSNQDHSGQFHGYYGELRSDLPFRARFWNEALKFTIGINIADDNPLYSGLYNGVGQ